MRKVRFSNALTSPTAGENVRKNRFIRTPDGERGLNYLCAGLKKFFKHAIPEVDRIVAELQRRPQTSGAKNVTAQCTIPASPVPAMNGFR